MIHVYVVRFSSLYPKKLPDLSCHESFSAENLPRFREKRNIGEISYFVKLRWDTVYVVLCGRYGNPNITWARLVQPTVDMCRNGITVSWTVAKILRGIPAF